MDIDKEESGEEEEVSEVMTLMEVDEGSPVVLDLDLDDFG